MKRIRLFLAILMTCLLPWACAAAEGLEIAEPLSGLFPYPEGTGEADAGCVLRYALPQFAAVTEADKAVNAWFQAMAEGLPSSLGEEEADRLAENAAEGPEQTQAQLDCQITRNDALYLSVLTTLQQSVGNGISESLRGITFARSGEYAGQPVHLSQVLGLESGDEAGEAPSAAARLAYELVWEIVSVEKENVDGDYLDGVNEEAVQRAFQPETDFYLDENENVVFFIQAGILTGEVAGALQFPFAPAEMLSAARE